MLDAQARVYNGLAESRAVRHAVEDVAGGLATTHLWALLGWHDIRQRYRRSVLGPFWLTISSAIMVGTMGILYAKLFNQDIARYMPYLAIGLIVWQFIATVINESCTVFTKSDKMIKQIRLPLMTHVCRMLWRNVLIFAHNAVIIVVVTLFFLNVSLAGALLSVVGLVGLILNCIWVGLLIGVLCTRFRDVPPIVASLVQIAFFLTPILWYPELLGNRIALVKANPFFHAIEAIRGPIIGTASYMDSLLFLYALFLVGAPLTLLFFARYRPRVPYWL
ncbi:MAG: ABC transporter permease [Betaproteobacteria bacterium]|nr:ABC transporter permease [Betaproteobacteria bacterium]